MKRRFVIFAVAALVFAAVVGGVAYNAGVANGIAHAGRTAGGAAPGGPYGWHHHWGGFPFFFPMFFLILFTAMVVRGLFWRGGHCYRRGYGYGCAGGCGLDEWHRRAHERMGSEPPAGPESPQR